MGSTAMDSKKKDEKKNTRKRISLRINMPVSSSPTYLSTSFTDPKPKLWILTDKEKREGKKKIILVSQWFRNDIVKWPVKLSDLYFKRWFHAACFLNIYLYLKCYIHFFNYITVLLGKNNTKYWNIEAQICLIWHYCTHLFLLLF